MTPKEQQLAYHILDLALDCTYTGAISELVTAYGCLVSAANKSASNRLLEFFRPSETDPVSEGDEPVIPRVTADDEATEPLTTPDEVKETVAAPAKTRKPRATKTETPAPEPELPPTPEPEAEAQQPSRSSAPAVIMFDNVELPDKTHAEKIAEGQAAYMAHFKELTDDDAAQREFRKATEALVKKHGGERISKVPEENIDAFLADLQDLIAASQPV